MKNFVLIAALLLSTCIVRGQSEVNRFELLFAKESTELSPLAKEQLDKLIELINDKEVVNIQLSAYTDNRGSESLNNALSKQRCQNITLYLQAHNIDESVFEHHIYGSKQPKYDNSTEEGRSKNRRVEIVSNCNIIPTEPSSSHIVEHHETVIPRPETEPSNEAPLEYQPPTSQQYIINPEEETIIIGEYGTKITIPANTFKIPSSAKNSNTPVYIQLQEFYTKSDIVLNGLTTQLTNGGILETGGMVDLRAYAGNEELDMKQNKRIDLEFPTENYKEGMKTWYGVPDENGNMLWDKTPRDLEGKSKNTKRWVRIAIASAVVAAAVITVVALQDGGGKMEIPEANGSGGTNAKSGALTSTPSGQNATLAKQSPVTSNTNTSVLNKPRTVNTNPNFPTNNSPNTTTGQTRNSTSESPRSSYRIRSRSTGSINCDRLLQIPRNESTRVVIRNQHPNAVVKMVFKNKDIVIPGQNQEGKVVFNNLPRNEEVYIIGISEIEGKSHAALVNTNTSSLKRNELNYSEKSIGQIKSDLAVMD